MAKDDWRMLIYIIAIPAFVYMLMLIAAKFPVSERVSGGATYKEMLGEFGMIGAGIAMFLILKQLSLTFSFPDMYVYVGLAVSVIAYGVYCQSLGRPLMIFLCLIMMPLATTELGTDGAITGIMEEPMKLAGYNPLWVLIYTSAIMMVLRFFAGPVVNALTPLGLLATCATLAIVGLYCLSMTQTFFTIFAAATLYGVAKTYFWPTTLGVVAEQFPKGGALTLNAIAGIGMLTVGIVGGPLIGNMQENSAKNALEAKKPGVYESVSSEDKYILGKYTAVNADKVAALPEQEKEEVETIVKNAKQSALATVAIFPAIMLACYIALILYFKSQGGYKPKTLDGASAAH
jgi:hypothetical protein